MERKYQDEKEEMWERKGEVEHCDAIEIVAPHCQLPEVPVALERVAKRAPARRLL